MIIQSVAEKLCMAIHGNAHRTDRKVALYKTRVLDGNEATQSRDFVILIIWARPEKVKDWQIVARLLL